MMMDSSSAAESLFHKSHLTTPQISATVSMERVSVDSCFTKATPPPPKKPNK